MTRIARLSTRPMRPTTRQWSSWTTRSNQRVPRRVQVARRQSSMVKRNLVHPGKISSKRPVSYHSGHHRRNRQKDSDLKVKNSRCYFFLIFLSFIDPLKQRNSSWMTGQRETGWTIKDIEMWDSRESPSQRKRSPGPRGTTWQRTR